MPDESRPPRKRRRRRRGKRVEGGAEDSGQAASTPARPREGRAAPAARARQPSPRPADAGSVQEPSLISRIGARLRKLVTRAPQSQH